MVAAGGRVRALTIVIPGEPHAQGRPRFRVIKPRGGPEFVSTYDPPESRKWKERARGYMREAMRDAGHGELLSVPLYCVVTAIFSCPQSDHRKTLPVPRRVHTKRPDGDNVVKAVKDALTESVVADDSVIVQTTVRKIIGAQGEAPLVHVLLTDVMPASVAELLAPKEPSLFAERSA